MEQKQSKGRRFLDTLFQQPKKKVEQPKKEETVQPVQQSSTNRLAYKQQNIQALAMPLSTATQ